MEMPPQAPTYHFQIAPVPNDPPDKVNKLVSDRQKVVLDALTLTAGTEVSLTVSVNDLQIVLLQVPSALK
jgi:hypothetical protein